MCSLLSLLIRRGVLLCKLKQRGEKMQTMYEPEDCVITKDKTGRVMFVCLECENKEIHMALTSDGVRCSKCKGIKLPVGYVIKK